MANHKRKKPRGKVRCRNCTAGRQGNTRNAGGSRRPTVVLAKTIGADLARCGLDAATQAASSTVER